MTTCTYSISARTGQRILSHSPCGKSADEGGLCRRHRREADAAEAKARVEREPAVAEQLVAYDEVVATFRWLADKLARTVDALALPEGSEAYATGGHLDEATARLRRAFDRVAAAEFEVREVTAFCAGVAERRAKHEADGLGELRQGEPPDDAENR
jgi:hypothetical protein